MKYTSFALSLMMSLPAFADWAVVPDLGSRILWKLVAEGRAEVVSSVSFGDPSQVHTKHTVFKIIHATESEGPIKWAVREKGKFSPVMCKEVWSDLYTYRGSSCSVSGCQLDEKECISEILENL